MKAFGAFKRLEQVKCDRDIEDIRVLLFMFSESLEFLGFTEAEANKAFVKGFVSMLFSVEL
jgi:hypothetical protein